MPPHPIDAQALTVFLIVSLAIAAIGFFSAKWKRGNLGVLDEWGLAGRQFGTLITWFLIGGDFYTAYTIIAVPALVFGVGALGFFALPYTIIVYPFVFATMPRLWAVSQRHGYVTPADFVKGRYGSRTLATVVAFTGIMAILPYIALQLVGMQSILDQVGLSENTPLLHNLPITIAFLILAFFTYSSGLRAPAMIAVAKDLLIYIVVIACIIILPIELGGFAHIFHIASSTWSSSGGAASMILKPKDFTAYSSLALGSALAAFMYPHTITSVLASKSGQVIRRNAALLPAYTLLLGLIALLGIMGVAAGLHPASTSQVVPELLSRYFPSWFAGLSFAAIVIAALVPAAIMSIAAANLYTRNFYREFLRPNATPAQESSAAKNASIFVQIGALIFVFLASHTFIINLQLLGGIWILQTLPAIVFGLWKRCFHHHSLLLGWGVGIVVGTSMAAVLRLHSSVYTVHMHGFTLSLYAGIWSLAANLLVTAGSSYGFDRWGKARRQDATVDEDYLMLEKQPIERTG
ncbi:MAG: sodium:solute symporter [Acidobacteriaceae bacterium]